MQDVLVITLNWIDRIFFSPLMVSISIDFPFSVAGAVLAFLFLYYKRKERVKTIINKLFSSRVWLHDSSILDFKINLFNVAFYGAILVYIYRYGVYFSEYVYNELILLFGANTWPYSKISGAFLVSSILFFVFEFIIYWVHRLQHANLTLWRLHLRHHSAQVLTPMTRGRAHPFELLLLAPINVFFSNLVGGVAWYFMGGKFSEVKVLGVNIFSFTVLILGGALAHSHIFIRFPCWLSHILISPAMHQVHHSRRSKHYNYNFGNLLAIWDVVFGTLYLPEKDERLAFGVRHSGRYEQTLKGFLLGRYGKKTEARD